jgi:FixJ family two-component response regulator
MGEHVLAAASLDEVIALGDRVLRCGLILIDVNLGAGKPNGLSVVSWLREHGFPGELVLVTGHGALSPEVQQARGAEGVPVLSKPLEADALLSLVEGRL